MATSSRVVSATALALSAASGMAFVAPPAVAPSQEKASSTSLRAGFVHQQPAASPASAWGLTAIATTAAASAAVAGAVQRRSRAPQTARQVVGVCLPLTEKFDPLNLGNTDAKMDRYTAVEIKHGRISMIAVLGYIMPEIFRFPGCESFKNGLGAFESIPLEGWIQLVALIGAHEVLVKPRQGGMGLYDFGLGTELLDGLGDEELERKQTVERNNGRLAMVAILGLMWQDGTFGMAPIEYMSRFGWWGTSVEWFVKDIGICRGDAICALPQRGGRTTMRAIPGALSEGPYIETETYPAEPEMSAAVPYLRYPKQLKGWVGEEKGFDPLGVTDALPVYWVREAELKHGRVCMLATVGWIATDLGMRFPGEKFQTIASAVEAHDKAVAAGYMLPFLGAIGTFELYGLWLIFKGWPKEIKRDAGDFFVGKNFLPKDAEKEKDMRLKELENGRLAMFAFSGIVTQAVITGKPWPFM